MVTVAIVCYLVLVGATSCAAFILYGIDKRRAGTVARRIPERTLQLLALAGGWPGALLGQRVFRHKTRKIPFLIVFWLLAALHVLVVLVAWKMVFGFS